MTEAKMNLDLIKDLSTNGCKCTRDLGEINLRNWGKLIKQQIVAYGLLIEACAGQIKLSAQTADVGNLISWQAEAARKSGESMLETGRNTIAIGTEMNREYRAWFESVTNTFWPKYQSVIH